MKPLFRKIANAALLSLGMLAAPLTMAQTFCIYDPLGAGGDYYTMFKDYEVAAKRWGVQIELRAYTDDGKLDDDFRSGVCDMASMLGMRARQFNLFTGTIDAPGVIDNYSQLKDVMALVASPKLAKFMSSNGYEVVGVVPIGPTYVVTSDHAINSFARAKGKHVTVMAWDKTQSDMANFFGVIPVPTDISHYAKTFTDGKVDIIVVPLALYKALELNKGIGSGGIIRRPLFQFTMQVVAHEKRFPPGFGQQSREFVYTESSHAIGLARNLEASVDPHIWIYAVKNEMTKWDTDMRALLEKMTANGSFDKTMLSLLKRVRCRTNVEEPECAPYPSQTRDAMQQ